MDYHLFSCKCFILVCIVFSLTGCLNQTEENAIMIYEEEKDDTSKSIKENYWTLKPEAHLDFNEETDRASQESETWVEEPLAVAEHYMNWPPGEPRCQQMEIIESTLNDAAADIFMETYHCPDDAVRDIAYYLQLEKMEQSWEIKWIGMKWKCARGEDQPLKDVWHIEACP